MKKEYLSFDEVVRFFGVDKSVISRFAKIGCWRENCAASYP